MAPDRCRIAGWRPHPEGLSTIPNSIDTRDHGGTSTTERQPADYLEVGPREAASARPSRCTMRRRYPRSMRYALRQLSHRVVKCVIAHGIVLEAVFPQCGQVMETTSVSAIGTAPSPVFTRNIAVNSISWDRQLHSGRNCRSVQISPCTNHGFLRTDTGFSVRLEVGHVEIPCFKRSPSCGQQWRHKNS